MSRWPMFAVLLATAFMVVDPPPTLGGDRHYLDYATFAAIRSLAPELGSARLCQLTDVAHDLWRDGQLRVPSAGIARGDFADDGGEYWALLLSAGPEELRCEWVLIVRRVGDGWQRWFLERLPREDLANATLVWNGKTKAIALDVGERTRISAPATMTSVDGRVVAVRAGFVVEARIISYVIRWDSRLNRFGYVKLRTPWLLVEDSP